MHTSLLPSISHANDPSSSPFTQLFATFKTLDSNSSLFFTPLLVTNSPLK
ncbi:hypothetical protein Hanom_Chr06g00491391 [Helianthus anomalus]